MSRRVEGEHGLAVRPALVPDNPNCEFRKSQESIRYSRGGKQLRPFFNRRPPAIERKACDVHGCSWIAPGVCALMSEMAADARENLVGGEDDILDASL